MKMSSESAPLTDVTIVTVFHFARYCRREAESKRSHGMRVSGHDDALAPWRVNRQKIGNVRNNGAKYHYRRCCLSRCRRTAPGATRTNRLSAN